MKASVAIAIRLRPRVILCRHEAMVGERTEGGGAGECRG
jgi:hypothetical protein